MLKLNFAFLVASVMSVFNAAAEELPVYEGIYIQMADGELVELPQIASQGTRAAEGSMVTLGSYSGYAPPGAPKARLLSDVEIFGAPVIDISKAVGFIVNARNDTLDRINAIVPAEQLFIGMKPTEASYHFGQMINRELALSYWGYPNSTLRVQNIDDFNTKYIISTPSDYFWINGFATPIADKNGSKTVNAIGFYVVTETGNIHPFFTKQSVGMLLSNDVQLFDNVRQHFHYWMKNGRRGPIPSD
jgi:hypothetical protein